MVVFLPLSLCAVYCECRREQEENKRGWRTRKKGEEGEKRWKRDRDRAERGVEGGGTERVEPVRHQQDWATRNQEWRREVEGRGRWWRKEEDRDGGVENEERLHVYR